MVSSLTLFCRLLNASLSFHYLPLGALNMELLTAQSKGTDIDVKNKKGQHHCRTV